MFPRLANEGLSCLFTKCSRYKFNQDTLCRSEKEIQILEWQARQEIERLTGVQELFIDPREVYLESFLSTLSNSDIRVVGPELIFGKIYDRIGFNQIPEPLFRHLVISRLVHPGRKLKTIDYLKRMFNGMA